MDDVADGEYRTRSFEEHFRPDARSDYSDLITKESPIPPRTETKKEDLWHSCSCDNLVYCYPSY